MSHVLRWCWLSSAQVPAQVHGQDQGGLPAVIPLPFWPGGLAGALSVGICPGAPSPPWDWLPPCLSRSDLSAKVMRSACLSRFLLPPSALPSPVIVGPRRPGAVWHLNGCSFCRVSMCARPCPLYCPWLVLFPQVQVPRSLASGVGDAHLPPGLSAATAGTLCGHLAPVARS